MYSLHSYRFSQVRTGTVSLGTLELRIRENIFHTVGLLQENHDYFNELECSKVENMASQITQNESQEGLEKILDSLEIELTSNPNDLNFLALKGKCFCFLEDFVSAERVFDEFLGKFSKLTRKEKILSGDIVAMVWECRGFSRFEQRNLEEAITDFRNCIKYSRFDDADPVDLLRRSKMECRVAYCLFYTKIRERTKVRSCSDPTLLESHEFISIVIPRLKRLRDWKGGLPTSLLEDEVTHLLIDMFEISAHTYMSMLGMISEVKFEVVGCSIEDLSEAIGMSDDVEYLCGCLLLRGECFVACTDFEEALSDFNRVFDVFLQKCQPEDQQEDDVDDDDDDDDEEEEEGEGEEEEEHQIEDAEFWVPSFIRLLFFRGVVYNELEMYELALADYNMAIELHKKFSTSPEDDMDESMTDKQDQGRSHTEEDAAILSEDTLRNGMITYALYMNRCIVKYRFGNVEEARMDYQKVFEQNSLRGIFMAQISHNNVEEKFRRGIGYVDVFNSTALSFDFKERKKKKIDKMFRFQLSKKENSHTKSLMEYDEESGVKYEDNEEVLNKAEKVRYCRYCMTTGRKKMMRCGSCYKSKKESVYYCDKVCQKGDWKYHKKICGK